MEIQAIKVGIDNCYIIRDEGTILIDAGMPEKFDKFTRGLKRNNIDAKQISLIVVTHCHWDHIGCLKKIKELTGAKVAAQKYEKAILENGEIIMPPGITRWGKIFGAFLESWSKKFSIEPIVTDIEIGEKDFSLKEFGIKGNIVYTPGHSLGSVSVILDSGDAFVGDMAMNGLPLTLGPNLPIFADDIPTLKKNWQKLIDKGVKNIYPAHGKTFTIEKLIKKVVYCD